MYWQWLWQGLAKQGQFLRLFVQLVLQEGLHSVQYTLAHMLLHIGHCALIAVRTTTLFVLSTQYNTHLHMWHYWYTLLWFYTAHSAFYTYRVQCCSARTTTLPDLDFTAQHIDFLPGQQLSLKSCTGLTLWNIARITGPRNASGHSLS